MKKPKELSAGYVALLFLLVAGFYIFSATSNGLSYELYTQALSAGHLNVEPSVDHGDISLYKGRYYLYFGPAPVVTLLIPWKVLTGHEMPRSALVAVLLIGIFLVSLAILSRFFKLLKIPRRGFEFILCGTVFGFCSLAGYYLRFSAIYEAAIASAIFWTLLSCYFSMRFFMSHQASQPMSRYLLLASFSGGMAAASRYSYILCASFILFWTLFAAYFPSTPKLWSKKALTKHLAPIAYAAGPFLGFLFLLGLLNYLRFDNFFEFGTKYMIAAIWKFPGVSIGIHNVWQNFCLLFCGYTRTSSFFPFFDAFNTYYFFPIPFDKRDPQPVVNIFHSIPFLFWIFPAVILGIKSKKFNVSPFGFLLVLFLVPALINLFILLIMPALAMRYLMDFLPFLLILSCFGFVVVLRRFYPKGLIHQTIKIVSVCCVAFSVISGLAWSMTGHSLKFKNESAAIYQRIEKSFEWITELFFEESHYGPIQLKARFQEFSPLPEPLVLTGRPNWNYNAIFLKYVRPKVVQFGFYPGEKLSQEVFLDPTKLYELEVRMGSLFPSGHLGSLWVSNLSHCLQASPFHPVPQYLKDRNFEVGNFEELRVTLDGKVVLQGKAEFFPSSPDEVKIGSHPLAHKIGWSEKFSGSVQEVSRLRFLKNK